MKEHKHKWAVFTKSPLRLICEVKNCEVVSDIDTALANAKAEAANQAKIEILVTQLRNGDLRKSARDVAYAYVRKHGAHVEVPEQRLFV